MKIDLELAYSGYSDITFEDSDINNMWNILMEDQDYFQQEILSYINNNFEDLREYWIDSDEVKKLYDNLKSLFE